MRGYMGCLLHIQRRRSHHVRPNAITWREATRWYTHFYLTSVLMLRL